MDWLFENLGKLAPVVIFLLYAISSLRGRKETEEEQDPKVLERTRRIQEEIRRKIQERRQGGAGESARPEARSFEPTAPEPELVFEPQPFEAPVSVPDREVEAELLADQAAQETFSERQRQIEAEIEEARVAKEAALVRAKAVRRGAADAASAVSPVKRDGVREELLRGLDSPKSLKASILIREVLGKPMGLR